MILSTLFKLLLSLNIHAKAHCPNEFNHNNKKLCADIKWEKTDVERGATLMSPILNDENTLPFDTHYSNFWLQIWEKDDSNHTLIFLNDLEVQPFMLMLGMPNHSGFAQVTQNPELGYGLRTVFIKMRGCWSLSLKISEFFHIIKIESYNNLNYDENFEQMSICSLCSTPETSENIEHHNH